MRWLGLLGVVCLGCGDLPTEIRVNLEVDESLLDAPGMFSLRAFDDEGGIVHTQERPTGTDFPRRATLQIQPLDGPTAWIELTLTRGDGVLVREFALVYVDGAIVEHDLRLTEACLNSRCPEGETCDEGLCIAAGFCDTGPRSCAGGLQQTCEEGVWAIRCE